MAKAKKRVKPKDTGRRVKKKVSILTAEQIEYVDWKDANLLRRFLSERSKIRARRVTGNNTQQQKMVADAIKIAREMALVPYANRVTTQRSGRGDRERISRADAPLPRPSGPPPASRDDGRGVDYEDADHAVDVERSADLSADLSADRSGEHAADAGLAASESSRA